MKQTAVETLIEIYYGNEGQLTIKDLEQAKAMEKKQLCYFYIKGAEAELNNPYVTNIEFYNKTFKSK